MSTLGGVFVLLLGLGLLFLAALTSNTSSGSGSGSASASGGLLRWRGGDGGLGLQQARQQQQHPHDDHDHDHDDGYGGSGFPTPRAGLLPPVAHPDAVNPLPCAGLGDCFNLTRCKDPETFPIYIYPWNDTDYRTCDFFWPRAIRDSAKINRTTNPEEACLLVPNVETACPLNVCAQDHETTMAMLRALPFWDGGRNHLMFSTRDRPPWQCDRAISVSGGTWLSSYREGLDVAFPLFYPHMQDRTPTTPINPWEPNATRVEGKGNWGPMPPPGSPRNFLLTFKGHRYPVPATVVAPDVFKNVDVRDRLRMLHRPPSMVVLTKCLAYQEKYCAEDEAGFESHNMAELMNTTFGLAPRGYAITSHRLLELMSVNAIPVILQDGSLLPFQEWLDWSQFALLVPEHSTAAIPAMLHAMAPATVLRMQQRGKAVYDRYLKDEGTLALALVETLKARIQGLKAAAAEGQQQQQGRVVVDVEIGAAGKLGG